MFINGDNVLVVGGAVGGDKICEIYSQHGSSVIIADKNVKEGEKLAARLASISRSNIVFEFVDVTQPDSIERMIANIKAKFGSISHMVSLVGGALQEEWEGLQKSNQDTIYKTTLLNLLSHEYLIKYAKELLIHSLSKNKSIMFMGSINALGAWDLASYSAAKAGLIGLMNGAAKEFTLCHKIRINVLLPGTILSQRTLQQPKDIELLKDYSLLKEFPTKEEIAEAVFMFSHKLTHCTQQTLIIDSGQTAYAPQYNKLSSTC
ncbi:3-oxoacyl-[acyl carrier protein] reductase [Beggiatoa sp. PS]|nr:3-oxoacyl-[acyl carrier protein] reductase [Beggiatoa sp. PS]